MGRILGIGNGVPFRTGGGGLGSSYWLTREPSDVTATITSDTTATVIWVDSAVEGADGYKIYAGGTLKATVAVGVQTAAITELTAGTEYIFKVVAYKGSSESTGDTDVKTTSSVIGVILNDEFSSLSDSWITTGIGTGGGLSVTDGNLSYTRATYGDFNSYVYFNGLGYTISENWELEVVIIANRQDKYRAGLAFGFRSAVSGGHVTRWVLANINETSAGTYAQKMSIWDYNVTNYLDTQTPLAFATGNRVRLIFKRTQNTFTVKVKNLSTDSAELTFANTWSMDDAVQTLIPYAYPCMFNLGGTKTIEYFKWSSTDYKYANWALIGDSIISGYEVSDISKRFANLLSAASSKSNVVLAAQSLLIDEFTVNLAVEIGRLLPYRAIILLGTNDLMQGDSLATMQTNYTAMINMIIGLGIVPILCLLPPCTSDVRPFNSWLSTTYGELYTVIDLYTPLVGVDPDWNATYVATGGVHPNDDGNEIIYNTIVAAVPDLL
jgi:lysophospholipase L1-like esterase